MKKDNFQEKMQEIKSNLDPEERHIKADRLLCKTLKKLGYGKGIDIFEKIDKWYS